ncbi:MAG: hypothetical protein EAX95_03900 [Candidatus Thorarchaeota archaeon]|nr:hypothetical protein [Candidatus Thorarchaeota archaeon]
MGKTVSKAMINKFDKFKASWEKNAGDKYESVLHYVIAALNIEVDKNVADAMMTVVVSTKDSTEDSKSPSGRKLKARGAGYYVNQFANNKNIARSYVGGTPENNYKIDKKNLTLKVVREQDLGKDKLKIFIECGGADSPRPVQVARNRDGQWKLIEYSSLCVGVKKTSDEEGDF